MIPEYARFHGFNGNAEDDEGFHLPVYDADQRKQYMMHLVLPEDQDTPPSTPDSACEDPVFAYADRAKSTLKSIVDKLAPEVTELRVDLSGEVTPVVTEWSEDIHQSTYYPKLDEFGLPEAFARTILRSEITELDRLSPHVDAVWHKGMAAGEKAVFKYFHSMQGGFEGWREINIHARLPPHPNLVPLQRLVLEEVSGSRVVGFTTPFIAGAGFDHFNKNTTPCFKLKHLTQLLQVVDDLNLEYGIVHQDIAPRNFRIDATTDILVVFDFGRAAHVGTEARADRNDVKGVILALHEIITRGSAYERCWLHFMDEAPLLGRPEKWQKHPDVKLDAPAGDYYDVLMAWVERRRRAPAQAEASRFAQAPRHFVWPESFAEPPRWSSSDKSLALTQSSYCREAAKQLGLPFVEWERPGEVHVDRTRRLLATGRYADDKAEGVDESAEPGKGRRRPKEKGNSGAGRLEATADRGGRAGPGPAHDKNRTLKKKKKKKNTMSRKQAADAWGKGGQELVLSQPVRRSARLVTGESAKPAGEASRLEE